MRRDRHSPAAAGLARPPVPRCVALGMAVLLSGSAHAASNLTQQEALDLAFPGCTVERQTVFLTDEQAAAVARLAGDDSPRRVVYPYRAGCADGDVRTAYFDTHPVRTLDETLMLLVGAHGELLRIEVLSFHEPPDYLPRDAWFRQFDGQRLGDDLELKRDIRPVTGATLTARAVTAATRRTLALHQVLFGATAAPPSPEPAP